MDELTIGDKIYISSKRAAAITGYAKDYVGQLCREGHVEAKMVGRSWYVLESSIRAHRFGHPEQVRSAGSLERAAGGEVGLGERGSYTQSEVRNDAVTRTWEAPTYHTEEVTSMPELMPEPLSEPRVSDARETAQSLDMSEDRESLNEMQAAWKEWFENKQESITAPVEVATREAENAPAEYPEEVRERAREEIIPEVVEEPVPVIVHRIPEPRPLHTELAQAAQVPIRIDRTPQEKVIIREKRVRRRSQGPTNLVYSALMIAIAGIVIAIAFVGSGFADTYLGYNPIIEYLGGASSISK